MRVTVEKDALTDKEGRQAYIPFLYGVGPDDLAICIQEAARLGIINHPTAVTYEWTDQANELQRLRGKEAAEQYFRANETEAGVLRDLVATAAVTADPSIVGEEGSDSNDDQ